MSYVEEAELRNWRAIASVGAAAIGALIVIGMVAASIYGVIYYEHLPSAAQKNAASAAARFDFLQAQGASDDELCAAASAAKSAYANVQDARNYQHWSAEAQTECVRATLDREVAN